MEFDNDRIIKPIHKIEITGWIILCLVSPLVNWWSIFHEYLSAHPVPIILDLLVIIIINILFFRLMYYMPDLSFQNFFFAGDIFFLFFKYCLIPGYPGIIVRNLFSFLTINDLTPPEFNYVAHSNSTFIREGLWIIINMLFAGAICFIRETMVKDDKMAALQRQNNFYKLRYLRAQLNPHFLLIR
jgi:hypothetical protein